MAHPENLSPVSETLDWSKHDDNCSKSCTRAGIALILVSSVGISILPTVSKTQALDDLLGYLSRRITLNEQLVELRSSVEWNQILEREPSAKSWSLEKILGTNTVATPNTSADNLRKSEGTSATLHPTTVGPPSGLGTATNEKSSQEQAKSRPAAPLNLRVRTSVIRPTVTVIVKTLAELDDGEFLTRAQKHSYRYQVSIYRWWSHLNQLLEDLPYAIADKGLTKKEAHEKRVSGLSLDKVEQLAQANLPDISEGERLLKETVFTLPTVGIPVGITSATLFIEIAVLLLSAYVWIWYREARISPNFPAAGTVFGAFARSHLSRFMLRILVLVPAATAALLAWYTLWLTYWNSVFAVLVVLVARLIATNLSSVRM